MSCGAASIIVLGRVLSGAAGIIAFGRVLSVRRPGKWLVDNQRCRFRGGGLTWLE